MALSVQQFLASHQCAATCTIFPRVKQALEGHHFADTEPIQVADTTTYEYPGMCLRETFPESWEMLELCVDRSKGHHLAIIVSMALFLYLSLHQSWDFIVFCQATNFQPWGPQLRVFCITCDVFWHWCQWCVNCSSDKHLCCGVPNELPQMKLHFNYHLTLL